MHFMDTQFSPRILQALHDGAQDCVPELAEGQTYPARDGYCEREMVVSVRVPNTLNLKHAPGDDVMARMLKDTKANSHSDSRRRTA